MTEKRCAGTNTRCRSYRGVCLIDVSIKKELTVSKLLTLVPFLVTEILKTCQMHVPNFCVPTGWQ